MCLIAINFQPDSAAPVLVAANREEEFDRTALPPGLQPGRPRVICGIDRQAGGTWLGVNEFGLLVAVTNRPKRYVHETPRSRGLLCRELLNCRSGAEALDEAHQEFESERYAGANVLVATELAAAVLHAGDQIRREDLQPGLHILANGDVDDLADARLRRARAELSPHVASAETFLKTAARVCSLADGDAPVILRLGDRGTVSSSLVALSRERPQSRYLHAEGPPDQFPYIDHSEGLREVFGVRAAVD